VSLSEDRPIQLKRYKLCKQCGRLISAESELDYCEQCQLEPSWESI